MGILVAEGILAAVAVVGILAAEGMQVVVGILVAEGMQVVVGILAAECKQDTLPVQDSYSLAALGMQNLQL